MASSVNKVLLLGNLGADPEVRTMPNGGRVANLRLATSESWTDKNSGERKDRTQWHRIVIFNEALIKISESYLHKGSKVYIEGQLENRRYQDQQQNERFITEVVLRPYRGEITLLDSRNRSENLGTGTPSAQNTQADFNGSDDSEMDDDIPF